MKFKLQKHTHLFKGKSQLIQQPLFHNVLENCQDASLQKSISNSWHRVISGFSVFHNNRNAFSALSYRKNGVSICKQYGTQKSDKRQNCIIDDMKKIYRARRFSESSFTGKPMKILQ